MISYIIHCRDSREVSLDFGSPDDSMHQTLLQLEKLYGLSPETTLNKVLGHFDGDTVMWGLDPSMIFKMVMAFWSGYLTREEEEIALESKNVH